MKFQVYQSFWGMTSLPYGSDEEWSIEEKLEKIAAAGFDTYLNSADSATLGLKASHPENIDHYSFHIRRI